MRVYFKRNDARLIGYYTGFVINITAGLMAIPLFMAIFLGEWDMVSNFSISMALSLMVGFGLLYDGFMAKRELKVQWKHAMIISALSWFMLMLLCALPYALSGHYLSYVDALFDVMSGFTTTGLTLSQDLDHMSVSLNLWRHIITFVGGQGMVVLALSFLFKNTEGAYKIYVGEAKDIELLPNVKGTARIIWFISLVYMVIGTTMYFVDGIVNTGLKPFNALLHGFYMFASAWSTGGFAPMSQNVLFYHSFSNEVIGIVLFVLGSLNFGIHYAIWKGNRKEIIKNIEIQSFAITVGILSVLLTLGFSHSHVYNSSIAVFRKGIYHLLSAHTTTGFGTLYAVQFATDWGDLGVLILIIAMLIGGSACSTAGGIKGLRIGIIFKSIIAEVKKSLKSERFVLVEKYHYFKAVSLTDAAVKSASLITLCYVLTFTVNTLLGCYFGYSVLTSAFESASVTGNVGLSIGITSAAMPLGLKISYILSMFMGRLEFMSVFAMIGMGVMGVKQIWQK